MTSPEAWHDVAVAKLTKVLGTAEAQRTTRELLDELGIARIDSHEQLVAFAAALGRRGGFAAAVGGLLTVHATIHAPATIGSAPRVR